MKYLPSSTKYTDKGVPYIKDDTIEKLAEKILHEFNPILLNAVGEIPIHDILKYITGKDNLIITSEDMGVLNNTKILGRIIISKRLICFDKDLSNDIHKRPIFRFTIAHEIGHWILHSEKPLILDRTQKILRELIDTEDSIMSKKTLITSRDWVEHHANVFAAALLMPSELYKQALVNIQYTDLGIRNRLGMIYLDDNNYSIKDYNNTISKLRIIFGVSFTSAKIRLETLGLLYDGRKKPTHISKYV